MNCRIAILPYCLDLIVLFQVFAGLPLHLVSSAVSWDFNGLGRRYSPVAPVAPEAPNVSKLPAPSPAFGADRCLKRSSRMLRCFLRGSMMQKTLKAYGNCVVSFFSLSAFQTQGLFLGFNHFNQDLQQYLWLPCLSTTSGKAKCPHFRAKLFAAWCLAILANCMDPHPKHVAISTQKPQDSMLIDLPIHDDPDHSPSCGRDCSSLCSSKLRDDVHRT